MVSEQTTELLATQRSRVISKILSPAVRLWLRSQIDSAQTLQFQIEGHDRQILSGHIPSVTIAAERVVYQGISISRISATGVGIRVNLSEVLRGKPLRLLQVVPVAAAVQFTEADLNASLQTPLVAQALTELLLDWLKRARLDELPPPIDRLLQHQPVRLHQPQVNLQPDRLVLSGSLASDTLASDTVVSAKQLAAPFVLAIGLQVENAVIRLDRPQISEQMPSVQGNFERGYFLPHLQGLEINLGSEVKIQQLELQAGQMICRGSINVLP